MIFLQYGQIDVIDGAFVLIDKTGIRTHIPVGSVACIMLEPGTRVSHAAVRLAATTGTLLVWVGEAGVRVYASGQPRVDARLSNYVGSKVSGFARPMHCWQSDTASNGTGDVMIPKTGKRGIRLINVLARQPLVCTG